MKNHEIAMKEVQIDVQQKTIGDENRRRGRLVAYGKMASIKQKNKEEK